ncbi:MAG: heavy metal-binding domain-containing protein [Gemmatimonadales bacterium]
MALQPCPECQGEVSSDASRCPHCGKALVTDVRSFGGRLLSAACVAIGLVIVVGSCVAGAPGGLAFWAGTALIAAGAYLNHRFERGK